MSGVKWPSIAQLIFSAKISIWVKVMIHILARSELYCGLSSCNTGLPLTLYIWVFTRIRQVAKLNLTGITKMEAIHAPSAFLHVGLKIWCHQRCCTHRAQCSACHGYWQAMWVHLGKKQDGAGPSCPCVRYVLKWNKSGSRGCGEAAQRPLWCLPAQSEPALALVATLITMKASGPMAKDPVTWVLTSYSSNALPGSFLLRHHLYAGFSGTYGCGLISLKGITVYYGGAIIWYCP